MPAAVADKGQLAREKPAPLLARMHHGHVGGPQQGVARARASTVSLNTAVRQTARDVHRTCAGPAA